MDIRKQSTVQVRVVISFGTFKSFPENSIKRNVVLNV